MKNKYMQLVSNVPVLKILFLKELQVYKLFAWVIISLLKGTLQYS